MKDDESCRKGWRQELITTCPSNFVAQHTPDVWRLLWAEGVLR